MTQTADVFTAVESALRDLTKALATGNAEAVLAAEAPLRAATDELVALAQSGRHPDVARVRQAARAIRIVLLECKALGDSAEALRRVLQPGAAYDGASRRAPAVFRTLDSRA